MNEIQIACEGPLCNQFILTKGTVLNETINIIELIGTRSLKGTGWEYRMIDGRSKPCCPRCLKEINALSLP